MDDQTNIGTKRPLRKVATAGHSGIQGSSMGMSSNSGRMDNSDILGLPSNFKGVSCGGNNEGDYVSSSSCQYFNTNDMSERVSTQFTESKIDSGQDSNSFDSVSGGTPNTNNSPKMFEKKDDGGTNDSSSDGTNTAANNSIPAPPTPPVQHSNKRFKSDRTGTNVRPKPGAANVYFSYNL